MKDNHRLSGGGKLLSQYRKLWAEYLVKYVRSYQRQDIPISYMTIQNEPEAKQIWESCLYSPYEEADLLKNYLSPTFQENNLDTHFFIWDHNKDKVLERSLKTLIDYHALNSSSRYRFSLVYRWTF